MQKFQQIVSILLLAVFNNDTQAQVKVRVVDNELQGLANSSITDVDNNIYIFTDADGYAQLPNLTNVEITVSRVGYENAIVSLDAAIEDTTIQIQLQTTTYALDEFVLTAKKRDKKTMAIKRAGYFQRKSPSKTMFRTKAKFGILIENIPDNDKTKMLRSVRFRLEKMKKIRKASNDDVMEVKIFDMKNGKPSATPLNTKPIFLSAEDFKKKNEIILDETIILPKDGVFVSLEFPEYEGAENIIMNMVKTKSNPVSYQISGTKEWHTSFDRNRFLYYDLLQMGMPEELMDASKMNFNIGISYYE